MSLDIPLQALNCIPKLEVILGGVATRYRYNLMRMDPKPPLHASNSVVPSPGIAASWIEYFEVPHEFARADR